MRDERILFENIDSEGVTLIFGLTMLWALNDSKIEFSKHCFDRIRQRYTLPSKDSIFETIRHGKIIEFHVVGYSPRVLIRKQLHNQSRDLCVVLDINVGKVLTVFFNDSSDTHKTLHEELYNNELNVKNIINECIQHK